MSYVTQPRQAGSRRLVLVILGILAVIGVAGVVSWLRNRTSPLPTTASLVVLSGQAVVSRADAGDDPPIVAGEEAIVQRGDRIRTGPGSSAKLSFSGGETTELGALTDLSLLELHASPLSRALVVEMALEQGLALSRIRHMFLQGMRFEVQTKAATFEAKGTVFECQVVDSHCARVIVHDGVVKVSMGDQSAEVEAGQQMLACVGQDLLTGAAEIGSLPTSAPTALSTVINPTPMSVQEQTLFPVVTTPTLPGAAVISSAGSERYTVQQGDTLSSISRQFGVPWKQIYEANKSVLSSPELIKPGQELVIPAE